MDRVQRNPDARRRGQLASSDATFSRGFTLVEMIGACVMLGILISTAIPMFAIVARERRATEQRQFALQHAVNLLEQGMQRSRLDFAAGELPISDADEDLKAVLPGVERTLILESVDDTMDSRQIVATIRWKDRGDQFVTPIRLSSWVYSSKEVP